MCSVGRAFLFLMVLFLVLPQLCRVIWISRVPVLACIAKEVESFGCEVLEANHVLGLSRPRRFSSVPNSW